MLSEISQAEKNIYHMISLTQDRKQRETNEQTKQNKNNVMDTGDASVVSGRGRRAGTGLCGEHAQWTHTWVIM